MKRTFISIPVPNHVLKIKQMMVSTFENPSDINWVKNTNLHLTLKFLGETKDTSIDKISDILSDIAFEQKQHNLIIKNTGAFPDETQPSVLWLGVEGETNPLFKLKKLINAKLETLAFPQEDQSYTPHVTIGRIKYSNKKPPNPKIFLQSSYDEIALHVNKMQFVSSELSKNGPIYHIISSHSFGSNK